MTNIIFYLCVYHSQFPFTLFPSLPASPPSPSITNSPHRKEIESLHHSLACEHLPPHCRIKIVRTVRRNRTHWKFLRNWNKSYQIISWYSDQLISNRIKKYFSPIITPFLSLHSNFLTCRAGIFFRHALGSNPILLLCANTRVGPRRSLRGSTYVRVRVTVSTDIWVHVRECVKVGACVCVSVWVRYICCNFSCCYVVFRSDVRCFWLLGAEQKLS